MGHMCGCWFLLDGMCVGWFLFEWDICWLISSRWDVRWLISLRMGYMLADFFSMGCVLADFSITCWSKHESSPRSNNLPSARPMWGESNSGAVGGILIDFQFNFEHYIVAHKAGYWSISISHFHTTGYRYQYIEYYGKHKTIAVGVGQKSNNRKVWSRRVTWCLVSTFRG